MIKQTNHRGNDDANFDTIEPVCGDMKTGEEEEEEAREKRENDRFFFLFVLF